MSDRLMFAALAVGLTAALPLTLVVYEAIDVDAPSRPACMTDTITVWRDDTVPCEAPRIDVAGITWELCDHKGGEWIGDGINMCTNVDQ